MPNIDVHVLYRPKEDNHHWLNQCLASLRGNSESVNVAVYPGINGNTRDARRYAYAEGSSEFVAYVDPDDMVAPGIFKHLELAVGYNDVGAYALTVPTLQALAPRGEIHPNIEWSIDAQAAARPFLFSAGTIVRRKVMLDVCERYWPIIPKIWGQDRCLFLLCALQGSFACVRRPGYYWRQHVNSTANTCVRRGWDFDNRLRPTIEEVEKRLGRSLLSWAAVQRLQLQQRRYNPQRTGVPRRSSSAE